MSRAWAVILFAAILVLTFAAAPQQGFNSTCIDNKCFMSASASPFGLILSLVLAVFVILYPQETVIPKIAEPVKIWERFVAFNVDFFIVLAVMSPITTIPILLAEANVTGNFEWRFERDFARHTDAALAVPGVMFMFGALFSYFYFHAVVSRQTVGQYFLGFRLEAIPGAGRRPAFGSSVLLGFIGLCVWPVSVHLAAKRKDKAFWWNLRTRTRVVRTL